MNRQQAELDASDAIGVRPVFQISMRNEETVRDVFGTFNEKQRLVLYYLVSEAVKGNETILDVLDTFNEKQRNEDTMTQDTTKKSAPENEETILDVLNTLNEKQRLVLKYFVNKAAKDAKKGKTSKSENNNVEKEMNFDEKALEIVRDYIVNHLYKSGLMPDFTVFIVWKCKDLQNWKYLLSSTSDCHSCHSSNTALLDGMYYELTYNGDKKEWYLDAYEKFQMEWIPCSERLPEKSGRYLVTRGSNVCGDLWNKVGILNYSDLMGLKKEKIWWSGNVGKSDFEKFDDVIAWQPLPEPYKADVRINFSKFSNFGLLDALREEFGFGDVKRSDCFGCEDETTEDDIDSP